MYKVKVPVKIATLKRPTEMCFKSESWANFKNPKRYIVNSPKIIIQIAINNSRSNQCVCITKSALDKNLKAKAISRNPKVTFTEFNHPPDCGKEFNHPGKAANNANGNAIANEKPNIPIIGPIYPPVAASTNNVPTIGPVHENETNAKVNAIKKIPIKPPFPSASTDLFVQDAGNWISKAPKKEAPKIINNRKNPILKYTLVAILFKESAPKIDETPTPKATYITMIESP